MIYKKEVLPEKYIRFEILHSTDFDNLFEKRIKSRGLFYYTNGNVKNFTFKNNIYYADVKGSKVYRVKVKIDNNSLKEISCTCPYHNDINKYCKHIYALLLAVKMQNERKDIIICIKNHINNILSSVKEMNNIIEKNKDTLYPYEIEWFKKRIINYKEKIKSFKKEYEKLKDFELFKLVRELNYSLNMLYDDLNELDTRLENNKKELENEKQKDKSHIDTFTYTFDDSKLFDAIDDKLSDIDLKTLYQVKEKLNESNDDTELIDKAIVNRKKKDKQIRKQEKEENRLTFGQILLGTFLGLSSGKKNKVDKQTDYLMPWEKEKVNKGNYDVWNFEEEELEDDDYYNDDLD